MDILFWICLLIVVFVMVITIFEYHKHSILKDNKKQLETLKEATIKLEKKVWQLENPFLFQVGDKVSTGEGAGIVVERRTNEYMSGFGNFYKVLLSDQKVTNGFFESSIKAAK